MSNEIGADAERSLKTPPDISNNNNDFIGDGGDGGNTNTTQPVTSTGKSQPMALRENGPANPVSGLQTSPSRTPFGAAAASSVVASGNTAGPTSVQQQQQANSNNNTSIGQKEANESEPVPPPSVLPAKPRPLIKSKGSVSPLPLKRAVNKPATPLRDNNGNNFDASPLRDIDSEGTIGDLPGNGIGIRGPPNPNLPTRPIGGLKPRRGGWKGRPDSETFNSNLSPTDDEDSGPGATSRSVNPVITSNVVVNRNKIGSSGGGAIGGGGRGGWGANQRRTTTTTTGSPLQSPAGALLTSTTGPGVSVALSGAAGVPLSMDIQSENSSSQPQTTPVHPAISGVARTTSRADSLENIPGPSGLLPHNPGVPGTIGGNPQSRYSNLSFWKARRVLFYRNGDPFFPGVEFRFKPGRDICTLEALLDKISARMDLPRGARYIFSMDGDRKYSLDELEDGSSYVVSSFKVFKSQLDAGTTLEVVKVKMPGEYERRSERSGRTINKANGKATAMKSATKKGSAGKVCYHCGKPGHFRRDCHAWKNSKKGDAEKKKPEMKLIAKKATDDISDVCCMAGNEKCNSWYVDSGASCHMTNDEHLFAHLTEKSGPSVVLAAGKVVKATDYGNGTLCAVNGNGSIVNVNLTKVLLVN
ncbi:mucin-5AC-like [Topomyia yanbarensis]|uniref:mucin-5AC-like n=1 Tax=Topomyia yanbarensis TaxID=2498891 RepID=UPI00273BE6EE|nr:mucin-5AC-like [Topomyia yanbarensis]